MRIVHRFDPATGRLGVIEFPELDFLPKRLYWISDFVLGTKRGNHAHKTLRQAAFVIQGAVSFRLFRGKSESCLRMDSNSQIMMIEPGTWREFWAEEDNTILAVLCNQTFSEEDYIRDFDEYLIWFRENNEG